MRTEVFIQVVVHGEDARKDFEKLVEEVISWPEVDTVSLKFEDLDDDRN